MVRKLTSVQWGTIQRMNFLKFHYILGSEEAPSSRFSISRASVQGRSPCKKDSVALLSHFCPLLPIHHMDQTHFVSIWPEMGCCITSSPSQPRNNWRRYHCQLLPCNNPGGEKFIKRFIYTFPISMQMPRAAYKALVQWFLSTSAWEPLLRMTICLGHPGMM